MELSFPFCKTLNNIDRKRGEYLDPASVALVPPHSDSSLSPSPSSSSDFGFHSRPSSLTRFI